MDIHLFDSNDGNRFLQTRPARVLPGRAALPDDDPAKYQIPGNATTVAPPAEQPGKARIWTGSEWALVDDHKGETWHTPEAEPVVVLLYGDPAEDGLIADPPPTADPGHVVRYEGGAWVQIPDHRGEVWWDAGNQPVTIDFVGDPAAQGLKRPPQYPTAEAAKEAMVQWIDAFTRNLTGAVPSDERLSWPVKDAAARAYLAGNADGLQTALLQGEASETGETLDELANAIVVKADLYRAVIAKTTGLRRKTEKALDAVTDPHDYETVLNVAIAEAEAAKTALGL